MRCSKALVLLSTLAVCSAAPRDPWMRIRSLNFEMFTTAGEDSGRELIRYFEQVHSFFQQAFGLDPASAQRVRLISFASAKEYQPYRPIAVADAYFQPGMGHDYIVMKNSSGDLYSMATHEYTHLLLRQTRLEVPLWLNEGLAELYSSLETSGRQIAVGKVIPGRMQTLAREPWIDLRALVSAAPGSPVYNEPRKAEMFYAESWALVHLLTLDERYSPNLRVMMESLKNGDSAGALQKAYGKPLAKIQEDLRAYINGQNFNAAVFDVRLPEDAAVQVETGCEMLAQVALAELLSNERGKLDRAREAYQRLARTYENRWEVEQGWGEFLARERKNSEALPHFTRAAGLGSDDPRLYLEYARLLNIANREADAAGALQTAIRLDPAFDEAHFEFAVTLVRMGSYREAIAEFHRIRHLGEEHAYRYFYHLAEAHYRLGDIRQARLLVEKGTAEARNQAEAAELARLRQALDRTAK